MPEQCPHLNCDPKWGAWLCRDCGEALTSAQVVEIVDARKSESAGDR